jgi:hypothetical protein
MFINYVLLSLVATVVSRDFYQEKQSYLLTEFPLFKYEGGQPLSHFYLIDSGGH